MSTEEINAQAVKLVQNIVMRLDSDQVKAIPFNGTCSANSEKTLVSPRIQTPFRIKRIIAAFKYGTNDEMPLRFYVSSDDQAPETGKPSGLSILQDYGQVDFLIGSWEQKIIDHEVDYEESGSFIKVYADNKDDFDHTIDVIIMIKIKERR